MTPFHTQDRKQSSLLSNEKAPFIQWYFFVSCMCGQGESNSRLNLGKVSLYHLTMAAYFLLCGEFYPNK